MVFHFDSRLLFHDLALAFIEWLLAGVFRAMKITQTNPAETLRTE
jgi:hypothetical protein